MSGVCGGCGWGGWWKSGRHGGRREAVRLGDVLGFVTGDGFGGRVLPGEQDVQVDAADHQSDEDGLRDAAVRESTFRVGDVDSVALGSGVQALDVRAAGPVGVLPGGAEVVAVLAEFVDLAEVAWADADGGLLADPRQFVVRQGPQTFRLRDGDGGLGRAVCGGGPSAGEVHHARPWWGNVVGLVEAGADHRGRGACGGALQPDRASCVCGLFEAEEVRLAGLDELRELLVVVDLAHGFVVQAGCGVGESGGYGGAGQGAVDEEGALVGALDTALLLFVVEDELVAQAAGGLGEMRADLIGVGTVGGQYPGREAERDEGGEGVDGVGPGPQRL